MIKTNTGFLNQSKTYLDARQEYTTIALMKAANVNIIPNGLIAFCHEDKTNYQFLDSNTEDADLGKWRKFSAGGNCIDDSLETSTTKTYSIDKIKAIISASGGFLTVDTLPDLTDPTVQADIDLKKIYLVPNPDGVTGNEKNEYVCIHTEGTPAVYREALVTSDSDWTAWKTEIEAYVTGGGSLTDDFATYSATQTTTTLTQATYTEMIESINSNDADYASYEARVTAIIITPATTESWKWELLGTISGASLVFDDFTPNNPIGKVKTGVSLLNKDALQVLKDMLSVDIPTKIKLTTTPESKDVLFEKGVSSVTDVVLTATIELGTGTISDTANVIFKKAGIAISTQPYADGTLTYTYTDTGANIADTTKYSVEVEYTMDGTTDTAKDEATFEFALPIYYGVSASDTFDVSGMSKLVTKDKKLTLTYTADNGYCVFAIPSTMSVSKIVDSNNFDNTQAFVTGSQVVAIGTDNVAYTTFRTETKVSCSDFKYVVTLA